MRIREKIRSVKLTIAGVAAIGSGCIHGSDILNALRSAADRRKKLFKDRTFAPDHYTVYLSNKDSSELKTFLGTLKAELLVEMQKYFQVKGYQINNSGIRINIRAKHTLVPGEMQIIGRFESDMLQECGPKELTFRLKLKSGTQDGEIFELTEGSHVIGRGRNADFVLPVADMMVSKNHCRIDLVRDEPLLRDLKSTNGTFLNDKIVNEAKRLNSGDLIRIGNTEIEVLF
jgi:hypothetical protein